MAEQMNDKRAKKRVADFTVSKVEHLSPDTFILHLTCNDILPEIFPGQFAEVEVPGAKDVFLRRPLSIHNSNKDAGTLSFYIKIAGKGTKRLSQLAAGEVISVLFPLGNHFTIINSGKVLLVAGGTGVAPMLMLAKYLKKNGAAPTLLVGGRTKNDIHINDEYYRVAKIEIATEDGSLGTKGMVTNHPALNENFDFTRVYTCGPNPMMKAVAAVAEQHEVVCEASLENTMACGIGVCLCCVVNTKEGHKCVCTEGPVFDTRELINR